MSSRRAPMPAPQQPMISGSSTRLSTRHWSRAAVSGRPRNAPTWRGWPSTATAPAMPGALGNCDAMGSPPLRSAGGARVDRCQSRRERHLPRHDRVHRARPHRCHVHRRQGLSAGQLQTPTRHRRRHPDSIASQMQRGPVDGSCAPNHRVNEQTTERPTRPRTLQRQHPILRRYQNRPTLPRVERRHL